MKPRRVLSAILAVIFCITTIVTPVSAADLAPYKDSEVFFSGHGHIDTAWQWTFGKTISDYLFNTWRDQLDLIEKNLEHGYKFSSSTAEHYEWAKEYYPALYEEIKGRVNDGLWDIVGGQWTEADTVMISGESTVRQFLLGQTYFQNEFGKKAEVGFLPDSPSHSWILPQIMTKSGLDAFTATRVSALPVDEYYELGNPNYVPPSEKHHWGGRAEGSPHYTTTNGTVGWDNFNWKGADGTELLSYKPSNFYESGVDTDRIRDALKYNEKELGFKKGMMYGGSGDRGGGPVQWHHINEILKYNADPNSPNVRFSNLIDYFDSLTVEEVQKIKDVHTFEDELYYNHELGLYTTHGEMKKYNNDNEVAAESAEKLSSIANWLGAADYPANKLNEAWKKVLAAQHHDVLTGCSVSTVYHDVWNDEEIALNYFGNTINHALAGLVSRADTEYKSEPGGEPVTETGDEWIPVIVFNSQSDIRTDVVETEVVFDSAVQHVKMYDAQGSEIPSQSDIEGTKAAVTFIARDVPPVGYAVFFAEASDSAGSYTTDLSATTETLENSSYKVAINAANGNISSILNKNDNNRETFLAGREMELHLFEDTPKETWNNWILDWDDLISDPRVLGGDVLQSINVVEEGPVKCTVEIVKKFKDNAAKAQDFSTIRQYVTMYDGVDRVDVSMNVDWYEYDRMLKASFPLAAENEKATFDLSYGTIERGERVESKREVAAQKWADMTDTSGEFGTSILSESKYGWDKYEDDHTLRLSLLRSPKDLTLKDFSTDMGVHDFKFSIYPHAGSWQDANTPKVARGLINPLIASQAVQHEGYLGNEFSFVSTDKDNIVITAVKDSEASNGLIIRLYESLGEPNTDVTVTFADNIVSIEETDLIEESVGSVTADGASFTTNLHQHELKTFRVTLGGTHYENTKPESIPVDLSGEYNMDGITSDANLLDGDFNGMGRSIPAELFPAEIVNEDIRFVMGSADSAENNVVEAEGQVITIGEDGVNGVYLLANSVNGPQTGNFTITYSDGSTDDKTIKIGDWSEYIGGWGKELNTDKLGHFFTHTHSPSGNEAYRHANLFVYNVAATPDKTVTSITLPDNSKIKVFAITAVKDGALNIEANTTYSFENANTTMIDDTYTGIVYDGGWTLDSERSGNHTGTVHYAGGENKTIEFEFTGSRIEVLSETSNNQLDYEVYIDYMGTKAGNAIGYDERGQNYGYQQVLFDSGNLTPGEHKIKLVSKKISNKQGQDWAIFDAFRVTDYAGDSQAINTPREEHGIANNTDPYIWYVGDWTLEQNPLSYMGDIHTSSTAGDSFVYNFNGTGVKLFGVTGASMASADIYIDGAKVDSFRPSSYRAGYFEPFYMIDGLEPGEHSIKVELKYGTLALDALEVLGSTGGASMPQPPVNAVIYDARLNADYISTTEAWEEYGNRNGGSIGANIAASPYGNASMTFTFKGAGVYVISESEPGQSNMDVYVDGKLMGVVNAKSPDNRTKQILYGINGLDPNIEHTLKLQRNENSGYIIIDAFMVEKFASAPDNGIIYDDKDAAIQYSGEWSEIGNRWQLYENGSEITGENASDAWRGSIKATPTAGGTLTFDFNGTGIYVLSEAEPGQSNMKVYIDDQYVGDTVAKTHELVKTPNEKNTFGRQTIFSKTGLTDGTHTLKLEKKDEGGYAIVDALLVEFPDFPKLPANVRIFNDNDAELVYGENWNYAGGGRPVDSYNNDVHYTGTDGATVTFEFEGTGFYVISETKYDQNNFDVYIDDAPVGSTAIKTYKNLGKQIIFGIDDLQNGAHTAKLVARGYTILDAVAISSPDDTLISGGIYDAVSNAPVSGAAVKLTAVSAESGESGDTRDADAGEEVYTTTSSPNGRFSLLIPAGRNYNIEVSKQEYTTHLLSEVEATSGSVDVGRINLAREGEWKRPDVTKTSLDIVVGSCEVFGIDLGLGGYKATRAEIVSGDESIATVSEAEVAENKSITVSALRDSETDITVTFYNEQTNLGSKTINVTVTKPVYNILIDPEITGGIITANPDEAQEGTTINLTVTPDLGNKLVEDSLKYNDTPITGTSFTMPNEEVTVTGEFEKDDTTTAAQVAAAIRVPAPAPDETRLTMPSVPEGFSIAIKTSSDTRVIALNGTITPPDIETTVDLVFTVTKLSDESEADTASIPVVVPAKAPTLEKITISDKRLALTEFDRKGDAPAKSKAVLTAAYTPDMEEFKSVEWTSGDDSIAAVDEDGNVIAGNPGTTTITVRSTINRGISDYCWVIVSEDNTTEQDRAITIKAANGKDTPEVREGKLDGENYVDVYSLFGRFVSKTDVAFTLEAVGGAVKWSTSDAKVAKIKTVDGKAQVTYTGTGSATITAASTSKTAPLKGVVSRVVLTVGDVSPKAPATLTVYNADEYNQGTNSGGAAFEVLPSDNFAFAEVSEIKSVLKGSNAVDTATAAKFQVNGSGTDWYLTAKDVAAGTYKVTMATTSPAAGGAGAWTATDKTISGFGEFTTTVKVVNGEPKAKLKAAALNTFWNDAKGLVTVTGSNLPEITDIRVKGQNAENSKTNFLIRKGPCGSYYAEARHGQFEETQTNGKPIVRYDIEIEYAGGMKQTISGFTIPIKPAAPKFKLAVASLTLDTGTADLSRTATFTLTGTDEKDIVAIEKALTSTGGDIAGNKAIKDNGNGAITDFSGTAFDVTLQDAGSADVKASNALQLKVTLDGARDTILVKPTVKTANGPGAFKLSASKLTFLRTSTSAEQKQTIPLRPTLANANLTGVVVAPLDGLVRWDEDKKELVATVTKDTPATTTVYKITSPGKLNGEQKLTVTVQDKALTATVKAEKGSGINLVDRAGTQITYATTIKNSTSPIDPDKVKADIKFNATNLKDKKNIDKLLFTVQGKNIIVNANPLAEIAKNESFRGKLTFNLEDGNPVETGVITIKTTQTVVKHNIPKVTTMYQSRTTNENMHYAEINLSPTAPNDAEIATIMFKNNPGEAYMYHYDFDTQKLHIWIKDSSLVKPGKATLVFSATYVGQGLETSGALKGNLKPADIKIPVIIVR